MCHPKSETWSDIWDEIPHNSRLQQGVSFRDNLFLIPIASNIHVDNEKIGSFQISDILEFCQWEVVAYMLSRVGHSLQSKTSLHSKMLKPTNC